MAGKGRALVDALTATKLDLHQAAQADPQLAQDLAHAQQLRQEIENLSALLTSQERLASLPAEQQAKLYEEYRAKQQQDIALWRDMAYRYPKLTTTQYVPSLTVTEALALARQLSATLVEFVQHAAGWGAFVLESTGAFRYVPLTGLNEAFWEKIVGWLTDFDTSLLARQLPAKLLSLQFPTWYEVLIAPLNLPAMGRLIIAPAGILHRLPLGLTRPKGGLYLYEQYDLSFTANLAALQVALRQAEIDNPTLSTGGATKATWHSCLAVAYPGEGEHRLQHALPETQAIAAKFREVTPLYDTAATPSAVLAHTNGQAVTHFSCHGMFEVSLPEQSGLALHQEKLTIQQIITQLRLRGTHLATLSACETSRTALRTGEEPVSLGQAMLLAGAEQVVASLWSVDDQSTRILFEQFYGALLEGVSPTLALRQAMNYVRAEWPHFFYWGAFQLSGLVK